VVKKKSREMKGLNCYFMIAIVLTLLGSVIGAAFLEAIYGVNRYSANGYRTIQPTTIRPKPRPRPQRRNGRTYKEICGAINPAPYAFPNKIPFPSAVC